MFFKDNYTEKVRSLIMSKSSESCITLDLAYAEVANVAWKRILLFSEDKEYVLNNLRLAIDFMNNICRVKRIIDILYETVQLALNERTTVYDTAFLQLAIENNDKLITTDFKFYNKLEQKYKDYVILP